MCFKSFLVFYSPLILKSSLRNTFKEHKTRCSRDENKIFIRFET